MNQVQLIGRLTKNVELRENTNGTAYCFFTVAVNEYRNGKEQANFISCVAWENVARNMSNFLGSGSLVGVTGRLSSRSTNDNGNFQTITNVVADRVEFLEPRNGARTQTKGNNNDYVRNDSNLDMDLVNGFEQEEQPSSIKSESKEELFKDDDSILWD